MMMTPGMLDELCKQLVTEAESEIETSDEFKAGFSEGVDALRVAILAAMTDEAHE